MKKLSSLILMFVMLTSAISTAFAQGEDYEDNIVTRDRQSVITHSSEANDDTDTEQQSTIKWWCYILEEFCYRVLSYEEHMYLFDHIYNGVTGKNGVLDMVLEVAGDSAGHIHNGGDFLEAIYNMSDKEAYFKMQEFIFFIEHLEIHPYYFNYLYEVCREETNDKGYYSKEVWDEITSALKDAKEIYDGETDDNYSEKALKKQLENTYINNAYFRLRNAFKNLCLENSKHWDLDKDGEITLKDVVKLQKFIAGLVDLNISEKMVVSKDYYGNINMTVVTDIQKYIAQLLKLPYDTPISNMQNDAIETALVNKVKPIYFGNWFEDTLKKVFSQFDHLDLPSYE